MVDAGYRFNRIDSNKIPKKREVLICFARSSSLAGRYRWPVGVPGHCDAIGPGRRVRYLGAVYWRKWNETFVGIRKTDDSMTVEMDKFPYRLTSGLGYPAPIFDIAPRHLSSKFNNMGLI